ncbi:Protein required for ethanol metabolism [Tulasnella sp. 418]|nr:Protein required for ethanol metabolism [Tulasnella sp. 418]
MAALLRLYTNALERRPLVTSIATSFTLFSAGDVLAQQIVEKKGTDHDWIRTTRLGLYGGFVFTPVVVPWYKLIDRVKLQSKASTIASKVALDQFCFAPLAIGLFFTGTTLLERAIPSPSSTKVTQEPWDEAVSAKLSKSYLTTLQANWLLFIPFQTINMGFVPLQHRLLAVNVISLFWNTYLSLAAAAGTSKSQQRIDVEDKKDGGGPEVVKAVV